MATKKTTKSDNPFDGINIIELVDTLSKEKQIDKQKIIDAIVDGIKRIYERKFDPDAELKITFNESGYIRISKKLIVVEETEDDYDEIDLAIARDKFGEDIKVGDEVFEPINSTKFNRLIINQAVSIIKHNLREAETDSIIEKYSSMIGQLMYGEVLSLEKPRNGEEYWLIKIDHALATLKKSKSIPGDRFRLGERVAFEVEDVVKTKDGGPIMATRRSDGFLEKILEIEIPEILEGVIKIKSIVRNPGIRSKIAVMSVEQDIDPIGSCVGKKGARITSISNQLNNERIDVCLWDEDKKEFIINALSPVKTISISEVEYENEDNYLEEQETEIETPETTVEEINEDIEDINENIDETESYEEPKANEPYHFNVVVPDEQYSLSIGKKGMTIWLVSKLTKSRLNIVSYKDATEKKVEVLWNGNIKENELDSINSQAKSRKNRNIEQKS